MESNKESDIFRRMQNGEVIRKDDSGYAAFSAVVASTIRRCMAMNANATDPDDIRRQLSEITGRLIDESTTVFPPF